MKRAALLAVLLLGGCSTVADMSRDSQGNVYPIDCPPSIVSDPKLLSLIDIERRHVAGTLGTTARGLNGRFTVTLDPKLSGWILDDTLRHEVAHVKRWIETGDPHWHAQYLPNVYRPTVCANTFHC